MMATSLFNSEKLINSFNQIPHPVTGFWAICLEKAHFLIFSVKAFLVVVVNLAIESAFFFRVL
jgi:uncharacterized membrane protein